MALSDNCDVYLTGFESIDLAPAKGLVVGIEGQARIAIELLEHDRPDEPDPPSARVRWSKR